MEMDAVCFVFFSGLYGIENFVEVKTVSSSVSLLSVLILFPVLSRILFMRFPVQWVISFQTVCSSKSRRVAVR